MPVSNEQDPKETPRALSTSRTPVAVKDKAPKTVGTIALNDSIIVLAAIYAIVFALWLSVRKSNV